jgi:thiol:disulfide interchange protein
LTRRSLLLGGLAAPVGLLVLSAQAAPTDMVRDIASYRDALSTLAGTHRFALVDIRADWCAVCHRIDREILSHSSVRRYLEHVPLVKVDVTAMDEDNRQLLAHLRASGPPTFFVVDATTGGECQQTRSLGSFSRRNLIRRLQPFSRA